MLLCPVKLLALAGADAKLEDAARPDEVITAAQHARVGEGLPEVPLAQVGVRVKVDDGEIGIALDRSAHRAEGDKVLAADHQRQFAVP